MLKDRVAERVGELVHDLEQGIGREEAADGRVVDPRPEQHQLADLRPRREAHRVGVAAEHRVEAEGGIAIVRDDIAGVVL
jgi:hypothetical protein